jgi:hypothetical protein
MKLKDASFLIRIYSFLMSNNKVQSPLTDMITIFMTLFADNYAIGNIQVCYADALPVSIVERS